MSHQRDNLCTFNLSSVVSLAVGDVIFNTINSNAGNFPQNSPMENVFPVPPLHHWIDEWMYNFVSLYVKCGMCFEMTGGMCFGKTCGWSLFDRICLIPPYSQIILWFYSLFFRGERVVDIKQYTTLEFVDSDPLTKLRANTFEYILANLLFLNEIIAPISSEWMDPWNNNGMLQTNWHSTFDIRYSTFQVLLGIKH